MAPCCVPAYPPRFWAAWPVCTCLYCERQVWLPASGERGAPVVLGKPGAGDGQFSVPTALALAPSIGLVVRESGNGGRFQVGCLLVWRARCWVPQSCGCIEDGRGVLTTVTGVVRVPTH